MNRIVVASAGSGKTEYIIDSALSINGKAAILTFTNENEDQIKRRILKRTGVIPKNLTIMSWFSFLLKHGVRPFQGAITSTKITGVNLVQFQSGIKYKRGSKVVYFGKEDPEYYYFQNGKIYSDKISKFVVNSNLTNNGLVLKRMRRIFDYIFIDEVQDLVGSDLEILKLMMKEGITVISVGDPRQCTYQTHFDKKYAKYARGNIVNFFRSECKRIPITIDELSLNHSHRNTEDIIEVSSRLYPGLTKPIPQSNDKVDLMGVYIISINQLDEYIEKFNPMQITYSKSTKFVNDNHPRINMGKSKGLEFDRVIIFPTKKMLSWLLGHNTPLEEKTAALLY